MGSQKSRFWIREGEQIRYALVLIIFPLLLIAFLGPLKNFRGPRYHSSNLDLEYPYLMNSLAVMHLKSPQYREHPGTLVQIFGGTSLRLMHPWMTKQAITEKVLEHPEYYLNRLSFFLSLISGFLIFISGLQILFATESVGAALVFQTVPFLNPPAWGHWGRFSPETLLLSLSMLFVATSLHRNKMRSIALMGVTFGALLATKITSLFLITFPILMLWNKWKRFFIFCIISICSFVSFTAPIFPKYIFFHRQTFEVPTQTKTYFEGLLTLLKYYPLLPIVLVGALGFVSYLVFLKQRTKKKKQQDKDLLDTRVTHTLFSILLILIFSLFVFSKTPSPIYLLPYLSVLGLFFSLIQWKFQDQMIFFRLFLPSVTLIIALIHGTSLAIDFSAIDGRQTDAQEIEFIARKSDCIVVPMFSSTSVPLALHFGNQSAGGLFSRQLLKKYPDEIFFSYLTGFSKIDGTVIPAHTLNASEKKYCLRSNAVVYYFKQAQSAGVVIPFKAVRLLGGTFYDDELAEIIW